MIIKMIDNTILENVSKIENVRFNGASYLQLYRGEEKSLSYSINSIVSVEPNTVFQKGIDSDDSDDALKYALQSVKSILPTTIDVALDGFKRNLRIMSQKYKHGLQFLQCMNEVVNLARDFFDGEMDDTTFLCMVRSVRDIHARRQSE